MSAPATVLPAAWIGRSEKIQGRHLDRLAVVYVRQSSVRQLQQHQESTRAQYGLQDLAARLGWPKERVLVIDEDLGLSGASSEGRSGFQRLLSEVALDHVGVILGIEMSRLARSCRDWYQLLELCSVFGAMIGDLDGLYDPAHYNDRLLLGLKGTMSEAELHVLKQRMHQGKLQKARRGELATALPVGYFRSSTGEVVLDPDEQVQATVHLVFDQFERLGTIHAVLRYLVEHDVKFGIRQRIGAAKGELEWRRPNRNTLKNMLSSPTYAGAYVYGRRQVDPRKKRPGKPYTGTVTVGPDQWHVCLRDQLPAYISWEQHQRNLEQLASNRSTAEARGVVRGGNALLQGLLICGRCGKRLNVHYGRSGTLTSYACDRGMTTYCEQRCQSFAARVLDAEVSRLALLAMTPAALEVSLQVNENIERERADLERRWQQRLERTEFEIERAARQYHAVEPEHRLVARTLEKAWEDKLKEQRELLEEYERSLRERPRAVTDEERETIQQLAGDLPALWAAEATTDQDRKAILRQIIDRVVVAVEGESEWLEATVHWQGGQQTYTRIRRPVARLEQLSYYKELCDRVVELKAEGLSARRIAERLNTEGWRPPKRRETFNKDMVRTLLSRRGLTKIHRPRPDTGVILAEAEWWLPELAAHLAMPEVTLYNWVRRGWVDARQLDGPQGRWVITADDGEVKRLRELRARRQRWGGKDGRRPVTGARS